MRMSHLMRIICVLLLTCLAAICGAGDALAATSPKVALVIGNAKYPDHTIAGEFSGYGVNECAP